MTVTAQKEMAQNLKHYFDIACQGEPVMVSREGSGNVVILSEKVYKSLEQACHNAEYLAKLARADEQIRNGKVVIKTMAELEAMEYD